MHIAVIGFGYWGKNLIRNFHALSSLQTVCDSDETREAPLREQYPGVRFEPQIDNVLANPEIDAVAIATPAVTHFDIAKRAFEAGKDVYVEKPLALDVAQGELLVKMAATRDRILMVGHILQYHPAVVRLQQLVQSGELGKINYIYSNRLNIGKFRTEENILWSFAPHDISVLLSLLDEQPVEVVCRGGDYLSDGVADVTMTHLTFPSGTQAHLFVNWLHPFKEQRLVVVGSSKMAVFDDTETDKLKVYPHSVHWVNRIPTAVKADAEIVAIDDVEPLRAECQHFLDSLASRTAPRTDGREGLRVLRVLDACELSLRSGQPHALRSDEIPKSFSAPEVTRHGQSFNSCQTASSTTNEPSEVSGKFFAHPSAAIDEGCDIGKSTKIWHYTHVMQGSTIGHDCSIGQNCCISPGVEIGNHVKIQNNVSVYTGTTIDDDVFLGPSCVLTNVRNPRSQVNRQSLYEQTRLLRGATVGANATIVCGVEIGRYAFIAAGAVVTKDVPDYALMVGNPARQKGWMSRHGHRLNNPDADGILCCPESGYRYQLEPARLHCLDLDEDLPLPAADTVGKRGYGSFTKLP
jgi:UDP-2-acetamido-3-amino-2,3-dideoxy-glucuronate N-acetyltransferase